MYSASLEPFGTWAWMQLWRQIRNADDRSTGLGLSSDSPACFQLQELLGDSEGRQSFARYPYCILSPFDGHGLHEFREHPAGQVVYGMVMRGCLWVPGNAFSSWADVETGTLPPPRLPARTPICSFLHAAAISLAHFPSGPACLYILTYYTVYR